MVSHGKEHKLIERDMQRASAIRANRFRSAKTIAIWTVVIALLVIGLYAYISANSLPTENLPALSLIVPAATDHTSGSKASKVIVIEYSDFQCPACSYYQPMIKEALKDSDALFVYRHYPLRAIHRHAQVAAQAAEAAAIQGKFWQMHDKLFEAQDDWSDLADPSNMFYLYATQLGLDTEQYKKDVKSVAVRAKIEHDMQSGTNFGVRGTPTLFVNGKLISFKTADELKQIIADAR